MHKLQRSHGGDSGADGTGFILCEGEQRGDDRLQLILLRQTRRSRHERVLPWLMDQSRQHRTHGTNRRLCIAVRQREPITQHAIHWRGLGPIRQHRQGISAQHFVHLRVGGYFRESLRILHAAQPETRIQNPAGSGVIEASELATHLSQSRQRGGDAPIMHYSHGLADNGGLSILKEQRDLCGIHAPQSQQRDQPNAGRGLLAECDEPFRLLAGGMNEPHDNHVPQRHIAFPKASRSIHQGR